MIEMFLNIVLNSLDIITFVHGKFNEILNTEKIKDVRFHMNCSWITIFCLDTLHKKGKHH